MPVIDRITRDQRRALRRLADVPRGIAETLMLANGFKGESIDGLVLAGLATVVTDTARIGGGTNKGDPPMIPDARRKATQRLPTGWGGSRHGHAKKRRHTRRGPCAHPLP